jgi:hypothetical protein
MQGAQILRSEAYVRYVATTKDAQTETCEAGGFGFRPKAVKPSRHVSAFDLSLLADNRNTADGLFTKPSIIKG